MKPHFVLGILTYALLGLLLSGCGSSFHGAVPTVTTVEVTPASRTVAPGDKVELTALARDAQGAQMAGVQFSWQSSDTAVAEITRADPAAAEVTGKADGAATIVATAPNGRSGFSTLQVKSAAPPPPPPAQITFEKDIQPLAQASCAGCHPALVPSAGSMTDYQNLLNKGLVKPGDPDNSLYYLKPSGKTPHGGGAAWGANAQKVFDWISADAPEK